MIKHLWSLLANKSLVDPDSNAMTIVEVLEELRIDIQLKDNPFMKKYDEKQINSFPIGFELVEVFYREKKGEAKTISTHIEVVDPSERMLGVFDNLVEFKPEHNRIRTRIKFDSIGVTKSGVYTFKVYLKQNENAKKELVSEIPLNVDIYIDDKKIN